MEAPKGVGHHYIDRAAKTAYLSVGTDTVGDWKLVSGSQGGGSSDTWKKVPVEITAEIASQNYFDLNDLVDLNTLQLWIGNLSFHVGYDFTVFRVDNRTRVEFLNDLRAPEGVSAIAPGDQVHIQYRLAQT